MSCSTMGTGKSASTSTARTPDYASCPWSGVQLDNFSSGSVCLVLASNVYEESDYIRDYDTFLATVHDK